MFNFTNVGLSMCVLQFIQIYFWIWWLNVSQSWHACPFQGIIWMEEKVCDTLTRREKFVIVYPHGGKSFEKIPGWLAKVGIMLMLDNPMWQEKFCQMTHRAWWEKDIMTHVLIVYPTLGNSFFWSSSLLPWYWFRISTVL
jgi:hypothetical protein